jgi:hypothetical protein
MAETVARATSSAKRCGLRCRCRNRRCADSHWHSGIARSDSHWRHAARRHRSPLRWRVAPTWRTRPLHGRWGIDGAAARHGCHDRTVGELKRRSAERFEEHEDPFGEADGWSRPWPSPPEPALRTGTGVERLRPACLRTERFGEGGWRRGQHFGHRAKFAIRCAGHPARRTGFQACVALKGRPGCAGGAARSAKAARGCHRTAFAAAQRTAPVARRDEDAVDRHGSRAPP